jgi:hypothetical protein
MRSDDDPDEVLMNVFADPRVELAAVPSDPLMTTWACFDFSSGQLVEVCL